MYKRGGRVIWQSDGDHGFYGQGVPRFGLLCDPGHIPNSLSLVCNVGIVIVP